ncbi:L-threonine aldolase [Orbus hercynius]|uniref:L-threonine aldolase n=1 Tax=Orbus hercynius TaxID=593135 RepID=A0A495RJ01_9GAMM|nr:aminotransferase class I/II-fold pyridoxal phosphate-dependent enzyme [Orbus hercynius]RKS87254.1 L-threonine aldolase [Orbus hercynius]
MHSFTNDYNETAHPQLLEALLNIAKQKNGGYGLDSYCELAASHIKTLIQSPQSHVHFLPGGTITNLTFIAHVLRPHQAVIAAESGHVAVHETGAIEATGHKVITARCQAGKLSPEVIKPILDEHCDEHMVQPKLVYISNTTELGTIYSHKELRALHQFCQAHQLYLYVDGARLAMALSAKDNDVTFADLAKYTDAFYIGGTKVGAFAGEALVINNPQLNHDFRFTIKQKGGLMAKGWILGVQFLTLLQNNLYLELGAHSNNMAGQLAELFQQCGFSFSHQPQTNQIFVNIPDHLVKAITDHYDVYAFGKPDDVHTCLRFCASWSTTQDDIEKFKCFFNNLQQK